MASAGVQSVAEVHACDSFNHYQYCSKVCFVSLMRNFKPTHHIVLTLAFLFGQTISMIALSPDWFSGKQAFQRKASLKELQGSSTSFVKCGASSERESEKRVIVDNKHWRIPPTMSTTKQKRPLSDEDRRLTKRNKKRCRKMKRLAAKIADKRLRLQRRVARDEQRAIFIGGRVFVFITECLVRRHAS